MLRSYFDDSGTHQNSEICVAAGFRASARNWLLFETRWKRALPNDCYEDFHSEEFFRRYDAGERVQPLLQAVLDSDIWPVVAAIDVKAFREWTEPERKFLTGGYWNGRKMTWAGITGSPDTPFHVPFQFVVYRALQLTPSQKQMHFVFDRNTVLHGYMKELYERWKRYDPQLIKKMGEFVGGYRKQNAPLQAADLLAYCTYQFGLHQFFDRPITPQLAACSEKLQTKRHGSSSRDADFIWIDRVRMARLLKDLPVAIRNGSADVQRPSGSTP